MPYNRPWDTRRLRPAPHPMRIDNWHVRQAARPTPHPYSRPPLQIAVSPADPPTTRRPANLQFGSITPPSNASMDTTSNRANRGWIWVNTSAANMLDSYQGSRPSDDAVLGDLSTLEGDDGELRSRAPSPSSSPTSPTEPERTVSVEYMSDILCPIARNLPIRTLTRLIETAVERAISAAKTHDGHPYPVEITVIINSPLAERIPPPVLLDDAIRFTATNSPPPPLPNPLCREPSQPKNGRPSLLDHEHVFKYLIDYEMAYNDLKQCTLPPGHENDPNFPLEQRSGRFDPISRLKLLSRMLRSYFQVLLSGTSWFEYPIPRDGVLECVWHFMRRVVEDGDRRALKDLHLCLNPMP